MSDTSPGHKTIPCRTGWQRRLLAYRIATLTSFVALVASLFLFAIGESRSEGAQTPAADEKHAVKAIRTWWTGFNGIEFHRDGRVRKLKLLDIDDADLAQLKPLSKLEHLAIRYHAITDIGVKNIGRLRSLRYLDIHGAKITNDGLKHLQELQNLETLIITSTPIGDSGLEHLKRLQHLRTLVLSGTKVGDDGLAHLKTMRSLRELSLGVTFQSQSSPFATRGGRNRRLINATQITDNGLAHLKALPQLERLNLYGTAITDLGLKHLAGVKPLTTLNLIDTKITDNGLTHLHELKNLKTLILVEQIPILIAPGPFTATKVTDRGVIRLQKALPQCLIRYYHADFLFGASHGSKGEDWFYYRRPRAVFAEQFRIGMRGRGLKVEFGGQEFSNYGVARLQEMVPELQELNLNSTRVTDGAITRLATFKKVKLIDLRNTTVTSAAVEKLKKALPHCEVLVSRPKR